ncbi:MAG: divalent-cation tolerance protein CutA [Nitrospirae bacterium]|nr:divalent-cation tolerance protein CutA [Nitrospirota bacterium]MBF0534863.1 divalent-cation tolerance protein CutA [Nitrospirota bacterium]MBF0616778.1 divalent-cation tolerance protein CutA [Nitrospirota bacterium]
MEHYVVLITTPDADTANVISEALISENLAKCANIIKEVNSVFHWDGKINHENECLMIIKTKKKNFKTLMEKVKTLHPYTVPEIIALPIVEGSEDYLNWLGS